MSSRTSHCLLAVGSARPEESPQIEFITPLPDGRARLLLSRPDSRHKFCFRSLTKSGSLTRVSPVNDRSGKNEIPQLTAYANKSHRPSLRAPLSLYMRQPSVSWPAGACRSQAPVVRASDYIGARQLLLAAVPSDANNQRAPDWIKLRR